MTLQLEPCPDCTDGRLPALEGRSHPTRICWTCTGTGRLLRKVLPS